MFGASATADPLDPSSYNQWKDALKSSTATPAGEIRALPGFKVELVRPALPNEGSWIALAFDPKGRAIISREDKGLLRLALPDKPGDPSPAEIIDDTLLEVRGLLCEGNTILANANNSRALVELRDFDGDGKYEARTVLMETPGGVGHGRNQIARQLRGPLWIMAGDDVKLAEKPAVRFRYFPEFASAPLLPASWDRFHWSNSVQPPCGHVTVLHYDYDREAQFYCGGLRNPFGIAFNEDGEAFTYDADMEWDIGLPWYRPTRVIHLVSGADYGWRGGSRPMPAWYPDTWPAVCDIGKGSPTSVMFGTRSKFPRPWRDALFIMDWAYGIIYAVHLTPQGSTYTGQCEVFLQGRPLNVTSMDFGPDGAMYFITGGRRTQSGLYRVRWTGEIPAPELKPPDAAALAEAKKAREQRREFELFQSWDFPGDVKLDRKSTLQMIAGGLNSRDPFVHRAARVAMETKIRVPAPQEITDKNVLRSYNDSFGALLNELFTQAAGSPSAGALGFALAASRVTRAESQPHVLDLLRTRDWSSLSADDRTTLLRALQLSLLRQGKPAAEETAKLTAFVESVIPCGQPHPDQLGSELLVYFTSPKAIEKILPLIEKGATQEERLHYLFTLRHVKTGWTLTQRKAWIEAFRRESARSVGAHHLGLTLRYARAEFEATLTPEEKTALTLNLATLDPAAASLPATAPRPFVKAWTQAELEPQLPAVAAKERDLKRGRALFDSQCAICHRYGPQGGVLGPDLTGIAGRFDRRTILESLIDPWRTVADPYRIATAALKSGEIVSGRLTSEDAATVSIESNPVEPGALRKVPRTDATSLIISSLMPPGLLNTMTQDELLDLLAFMERGS
ncbi:MAG TPA: c-type cytochrome [Verrucomicrobiales bacterium]|nr:c-type cytochrome [Verrucomicrobiales bacterium]